MVHKIELSFGHRRRDGELLPRERVEIAEQQALEVFSRLFQGGQIHRRMGGWLANGHPMLEECSVIFALADAVDGNVERLWCLACEIATFLEQEACLIAITQVKGMIGWVPPKEG